MRTHFFILAIALPLITYHLLVPSADRVLLQDILLNEGE